MSDASCYVSSSFSRSFHGGCSLFCANFWRAGSGVQRRILWHAGNVLRQHPAHRPNRLPPQACQPDCAATAPAPAPPAPASDPSHAASSRCAHDQCHRTAQWPDCADCQCPDQARRQSSPPSARQIPAVLGQTAPDQRVGATPYSMQSTAANRLQSFARRHTSTAADCRAAPAAKNSRLAAAQSSTAATSRTATLP